MLRTPSVGFGVLDGGGGVELLSDGDGGRELLSAGGGGRESVPVGSGRGGMLPLSGKSLEWDGGMAVPLGWKWGQGDFESGKEPGASFGFLSSI